MGTSPFFDLDVRFEWDGYSQEGYSKVFVPNALEGKSGRYDPAKVNIALFSNTKAVLPDRFDMVNFSGFGVNVDVLSLIRDKEKAVEFCLADVRKAVLSGRISQAQFFSNVVRSYKVPYVFTSGAASIYEVKSPKEIAFVGEMLGFTQRQVLSSMSMTAEMLLSNKGW